MAKGSSFPWYFEINEQPVKVVATPDGGMDVLILNHATGKLERNMSYLAQCFEPGQNVKRLSEEEFNSRVEAIKTALKNPQQSS